MRKLRLGLSSREAEIVETVYLDSAVLDEVLFAASRTALEIVGALAGYAIRDAVYISSWKHLEGHVSEDEFPHRDMRSRRLCGGTDDAENAWHHSLSPFRAGSDQPLGQSFRRTITLSMAHSSKEPKAFPQLCS